MDNEQWIMDNIGVARKMLTNNELRFNSILLIFFEIIGFMVQKHFFNKT